MKPNTFRRIATIVATVAILVAGLASRGEAQLVKQSIILLPPGGYTISLPNPNDLMEISAGAFHTCVRKYNQQVYCWGLNGWSLNTGGQVGVVSSSANCQDAPVQDPNHVSIAPATKRPCVDRPTYVTTGSQIVAGQYHTCALNSGVASCWGANLFGAVGDGSQTDRTTPQNVMTSATFSRLAAGDSATCGLSQNAIYCWGYQPYDPSVVSYSLTPKQLYGWDSFNSLTLGSRFVCFVYITGSWGENDCQGIDNIGQLGVVNTPGTPDAPSWMPRDNGVPFTSFLVGSSITPGKVARSSAGFDYVCSDLTDGTVQCVGDNNAGQLGTSGGSRADARAVVNASGVAMQLHGVTTGSTHACALDASNNAWCWGLGRYGEIGNATTGWYNQAFYAVQVSGGRTFRGLAAGAQHTCGIGTDNYVYCWGDNEYGQLGVGYNNLGWSGFYYTTKTGTPQQVPAF